MNVEKHGSSCAHVAWRMRNHEWISGHTGPISFHSIFNCSISALLTQSLSKCVSRSFFIVCYFYCVTQMRHTIRSFSKVGPTILIHFVWLNEKTLISYWDVSVCVCTFQLDQQVREIFIAFFLTERKRARKRERRESERRKKKR